MDIIRFGIVGNMGPQADELFQSYIRQYSGAKNDQEHIPMVVVKNPAIPDRTEAILHKGEDPTKEILASLSLLEKCGVCLAVMTCNTAHFFHARVQKHTSIFIFDMIKNLSIDYQNHSGAIGLLATNGTLATKVYEHYFSDALIHLNTQDNEKYVHAAIYGTLRSDNTRKNNGIKSGNIDNALALLMESINMMKANGVSTIILGCTELPIVEGQLQKEFPDIYFIDPMKAMAKKLIVIFHYLKKSILKDSPVPITQLLNDTVYSLETEIKSL